MSHPSATYLSLPWTDAIAFFRDKVNLPTERWDDLWAGMHSRAFVVAGAVKAELLADLRMAVDKAISQGTTLAEFRKDFDKIAEKHGWQYKGGRGWRTSVIYDTNLTTAYSAGRYAEMSGPAVSVAFPYWKYLPSSSANRRPDHVQWYGVTLRHDHPWWQTHYPPNGWGCKCGVTAISEREYQRDRGRLVTDAPGGETYDYVDKRTGEVKQVPVGIDPSWDYNPGQAAWGQRLADEAMAGATKADSWENLTAGNWQTTGLAARLSPVAPRAPIGPALSSSGQITEAISEILGREEKIYSLVQGGFRHDLLVSAVAIGNRLSVDQTPYLPLLPELIESPQEVWMGFARNRDTGKVSLWQRLIKLLDMDGGALLLAAESRDGWLESFEASDAQAVNRLRNGRLVYGGGN